MHSTILSLVLCFEALVSHGIFVNLNHMMPMIKLSLMYQLVLMVTATTVIYAEWRSSGNHSASSTNV